MRMSLSAAAGVTLAAGICAGASAVNPPILKNTIVHSGNGNGSSLAVGNDTLDSTTFDCAGPRDCVTIVNTSVEMRAGDGQWKICPTIDGVQMNPTCPIQGVTQSAGSNTVTGNGWSNATVAPGMHTVTAVLSIHSNSTLYAWQVSYLRWMIP